MSHNLSALFERVSAAVPQRTSIVFRDKRVTYGELRARVHRLANFFVDNGLSVYRERDELQRWESGQEHIAIVMHNGNEYLEATLGAHAARAVPFNVNYRYTAHELAYVLNDASAAGVLYDAQFGDVLRAALPLLNRQPVLIETGGAANSAMPGAFAYRDIVECYSSAPPLVKPSPDDLHLLYTGGTTGMPKGTLWRQADLFDCVLSTVVARLGADLSSAHAIAEAAARTVPLVVLPAAPFMHGASYWAALGAIVSGDTIVVQNEVSRLDPADIWESVSREHVSTLNVVGEAFLRPLCAELASGGHDTTSLRVVVTGGAATTAETKSELFRLLPNIVLVEGGGSSESGRQLLQVLRRGHSGPTNVFSAEPGTCVLSADRSHVLAPSSDEVGWLARSGPLPLGYLHDQAKSESTFPTIGGMRMSVPGDRARLTPDGAIELLGRESTTINTGGEKVFAEEVERALLRHVDVVDVVVVGRPSQRWGQEVVALMQIVTISDVTDEAIVESAADVLARYKLPKALVRVDRVQRLPTGKPDYTWARGLVTETTGGR